MLAIFCRNPVNGIQRANNIEFGGLFIKLVIKQLYEAMGLDQFPDISLDELTDYTDWPARLLNGGPRKTRSRDNRAVLEEYDQDKWKRFLELLEKTECKGFGCPSELFFYLNGRYLNNDHQVNTLISWGDDKLKDVRTFANREKCQVAFRAFFVGRYLGDANTLVELGSGIGRNLFYLLGQFKQIQHAACGDLSHNGIRCTTFVAEHYGLDVTPFVHDHYNPNRHLMERCRDALVFTCQTLEQLPQTPRILFEQLIAARPQTVIHFEPVNEHNFENNRLLNLFRREYTKANNYNKDLAHLIKAYEDAGTIKVLLNEPNIFGNNILNPLSVIAWQPVYSTDNDKR